MNKCTKRHKFKKINVIEMTVRLNLLRSRTVAVLTLPART